MISKTRYNFVVNSSELFLAIENGELGEVERLLNEGADINAQDSVTKFTPLHAAISLADKRIVELLSQHSLINFDLKDQFGRSPISLALSLPYNDILDVLQAEQLKRLPDNDEDACSPSP